ncbi:LppX_LprAFG lipoprotein [Nocardioides sp. GXZ039]|uniref:LppX_LprAFG lipoprotein n=1 Tax=Nocardioides sp. GXZ039 TaxID=3136018 RepID=UPI0030F3C4CC
MMLDRRLATAALALALAGSLAACGGDDKGSGDGDAGVDPQEALAAAKTRLDETSGVRLSLTTDGEPDADYLSSAEGVIIADPPAFQGTAAGKFQGIPASDVDVVSVDDITYLALFGSFSEFELPKCVPDPATLLDPDTGIASLLALAEDPESGKSVRGGENNDQIVTPITATVPGEAVKNILPCAPGATFEATFTIDDEDALTSAELTGEFFSGTGDLTYEITIDAYDVEQEISKP